MLWVTLRNVPGEDRDIKHSLEDKATLLSKIMSYEEIVEVVASEDELQYIIDYMRGVPYVHNAKQVHWKGEFAHFIVGNWQ